MSARLSALLCILFCACGNSSPPEEGNRPVDPAALAAEFELKRVEALCERAKRCFPSMVRAYCEVGDPKRNPWVSTVDPAAAVRAGRLQFDQTAAGACLDALARECNAVPDQACWSVYSARVAPGAACTASAECVDGFCRVLPTCPSVCVAYAGPGEDCSKLGCRSDLYCSSSKRCLAKRLDGDTCQSIYECKSSYCSNSVCAPWPSVQQDERVPEGGVCDNQKVCAEGLYCRVLRPTSTQTPGTCTKKAGAGSACGADNDWNGLSQGCASGLVCVGGSKNQSTHTTQPGVCTAWANLGEPCGDAPAEWPRHNCMYGLVCSQNKCVLPKLGDACSPGSTAVQCPPDAFCDNETSTCKTRRAEAMSCWVDEQCASGHCSAAGVCAPICQ